MQLEIAKQIQKYPRFAIYGAQVVAYGVFTALRSLYGMTPECFIVSHADGNPSSIEDTPVRTLGSCGLDKKGTLILVAVTELLQDEICVILESSGFCNYICIGAHEEHALMSAYFNSIGKFPVLQGTSRKPANLALYEAKNYRDKLLKRPAALREFERSIQAGAGTTTDRIAPLLDNTGDNISAKNHQYCEMTAAYWIWKNASADWVGLEHYRRHLLVEPQMLEGDIDAVLPLPYICYPSAITQVRRFASEDVLGALLLALKTLHPDQFGTYDKILNGQFQYTYNLVVARREVYAGYCAWLFRITEYMETLSGKVPEIADTRALSYVCEVLTNIYFMSNQDKLRIKHAEKAIYT